MLQVQTLVSEEQTNKNDQDQVRVRALAPLLYLPRKIFNDKIETRDLKTDDVARSSVC